MLYLIGTPIGNLGDISLRALEILKGCDALLCEDTRISRRLLDRYEIRVRLISYHKFNEKRREEEVLNYLREGQTLGLVSDAGMPCIADPGARLVRLVRKEGLPLEIIPGPSALTSALTLFGHMGGAVQFLGFLPKKGLTTVINNMVNYPGHSVAFDTPHHIVKTLKRMPPETPIFLAREMTKKFEETLEGTAASLLTHFETKPPKGEFVLIVQGNVKPLYIG